MKSNYSPSVNIIRDAHLEIAYVVTSNVEKSAIKIFNDFQKGYHAFSIIGSYGTGKSSFLWALEQTLSGNKIFDASLTAKYDKIDIVNIVGNYHSVIDQLNEVFSVESDYSNYQKLFDAIFQRYSALGKNGLLVIAIDEFGKILEYAANNEPEKEMYFIQQLAEFVNSPERNILLLTTLHQGLDAYALKLSDAQKNEWRKVKGRLQEVTFNEPVEQLLVLAAKHFESRLGITKETAYSKSLIALQKEKRIFSLDASSAEKLENSLFPLDLFSAYALTLALQRYGQNERSLFSFLISSDELGIFDSNKSFSIASVYDYLFSTYYHTLASSATLDASNWRAIRDSIQRVEMLDLKNSGLAEEIVKTIGLLQLFASKGAKKDEEFLIKYLSFHHSEKDVRATIEELSRAKIIRYFKFDFSYKLFEGSDLDIEEELLKAENQISEEIDLIPKLENRFEFPIITAKSHSYKTGTPRLFEYRLSEKPINEVPVGEIDGFINLLFNSKISIENVLDEVGEQAKPILYGYFRNPEKILGALHDIEKTIQVLKNIRGDGDRVATKALESILHSNTVLLNHYVIDALFQKDSVTWIYRGKKTSIDSKRKLNQMLSIICDEVYHKTPVIKNELFNKHIVSSAIASARKNYFEALTSHSNLADLGFEDDKFPPEKTIYYTLLNQSGIHSKTKSGYTLSAPNADSPINTLWEVSEQFLASAKDERKKLTELIDTLTSAPYKLKQGIIDFWLPTFLFIRKGDYALYSDGTFKPYVNQQILYLITRNPGEFEIKSFELSDLRVSFFNKYREILLQNETDELSVTTFIESIRPILLTYKGLSYYEQNTKRISKEAVQLREAIKNAQDPENVFFTEFPKALNFDSDQLAKSDERFDDYIYSFQAAIEEIKNAYSELLNRIEKFITLELIGRKCEFQTYKKELIARFSTIKEHQLLPKQRTFLQRLNSPLNDRDSWLASIGQILIGKPLSSMEDNDESVLLDNLIHFTKELDNLTELAKIKYDDTIEEVYKLDFTSQQNGMNSSVIRVSLQKMEQAKKSMEVIEKELGKDKKMRIAILAKLLKDELSNGKS